jgi:hypothetical protein
MVFYLALPVFIVFAKRLPHAVVITNAFLGHIFYRIMCPKKLVPAAGLEPARPYGQEILSLQCLPFHHAGQLVRT